MKTINQFSLFYRTLKKSVNSNQKNINEKEIYDIIDLDILIQKDINYQWIKKKGKKYGRK